MSTAALNGHHVIDDDHLKHKNDVDLKPGVKLLSEFRANNFDHVAEVASFVRSRIKHKRPEIGLICGTGLGKIVNYIENPEILPYGDIPGFPVSTVHGHKGNFVFGKLQGKTVACMQGRIHLYEGYNPDLCTLPVRLMHQLGVHTLIVTNAAGGLNETYEQGDLMLIKDHLYLPGFAGRSPLMGPNDERFGPRFPSMNNAYDGELRKVAKKVAREIGVKLQEGVYAMLGGPQFETPAENRFFRALGADVIGMSTAHEVIVARHCGMKVVGMTLVTNMSTIETDTHTDTSDLHLEVLKTGEESSEKATKFMTHLIKNL